MDTIENSGQDVFGIVEEALATFPMEPVPETIYPAVMKQLEAARPVQQFKIRWLDIVVSAFLAGMAVFTLFLIQSPMLPPTLGPLMKVRIILLWQRLTMAVRPIDPAAFLSLLLLSGGLSFASVWALLRNTFLKSRTAR